MNVARTGLWLTACLLVAACNDGLRASPEGSYEGALHAFELRSDGTFDYEALDRPLRLGGTWSSTLEYEDEEESRGHIDLMVEAIELDGMMVDRADDGSGSPIYRTGEANLGWWFHQPDHAQQEREMLIEHEREGESRAPSSASFTSWWGNPR